MKHVALVYELQRYLRNEFYSALPIEWSDVARAYMSLNNDSMFEKLQAEYMLQLYSDNIDAYSSSKKALVKYMREEW